MGTIKFDPELLFFTADEHYFHSHGNIIQYCNRPYTDLEEMHLELIANHNHLVPEDAVTIHVGDFCMSKHPERAIQMCNRLIGKHYIVPGSHDLWIERVESENITLPDNIIITSKIFEFRVAKEFMVACHYAMRVWPRSHYGSWQIFGHSHGRLEPGQRQYDVGVDANGYTPVSYTRLAYIIDSPK